jgi:hypothetical protein
MKLQSNIADTQRWADEYAAGACRSFTKHGNAQVTEEVVRKAAADITKHPELLTTWIDNLLVKRNWKLDKFNHDILCELAAIALERGELPPEALRKYAAEILRQGLKEQRGSLMQRNGHIAFMLAQLQDQNIPLFPNRDGGRRLGRTYGCDIVVNVFKNAGVRISPALVEKVWNIWRPVYGNRRSKKYV